MEGAVKVQERPVSAKRNRLQEAIELDTAIIAKEIREEEVKKASLNLVGMIIKDSFAAYVIKVSPSQEPPT